MCESDGVLSLRESGSCIMGDGGMGWVMLMLVHYSVALAKARPDPLKARDQPSVQPSISWEPIWGSCFVLHAESVTLREDI